MALGIFVLSVALGLGGFALILFPEVRKKTMILARGGLNVFIEDKARTPEGARALFQQAIETTQEKYNKASDLLRLRAGELESARNQLLITKKAIKDLEHSCELLVQKEQYEKATILSAQREEKMIDLEKQAQMVETLEPVVAECKEIAAHQERNLQQLKIQKKQVIAELEMNKQITSMYDDLDGLRKDNPIDKLLDSVNEGNEDAKKKAIGARVLHENRLETKASRAMTEATNLKNSDYVEELKKKYGKV